MPKINWVDESNDNNQPRWEPRPRRERAGRERRDRRGRLEHIIAMASLPAPAPETPPRPPLHLIWGRPIARPAWDAEGGGGQEQRAPQHE